MGKLKSKDIQRGFEEDVDMITSLFERVFANIQTKITTLTIIFEFPNEKVIILQCPEVCYTDKTEYNINSTSYKYQFKLNKFIIQVLEKNEKWETSLDFGNNVIYSNDKETLVNVKLTPSKDDHYPCIEVETVIPSLQGLMNVKQVNIIQDMFKSIQKSLENQENKENGNDLTPTPSKVIYDSFKEDIIVSDEEIREDDDEYKEIETPTHEKEVEYQLPSKTKTINFSFEFRIENPSSIKLLYNDKETKKLWSQFEKDKNENKQIQVEDPYLDLIISNSSFKISKGDSLTFMESSIDLKIIERLSKDEYVEILAPAGKKGLFEIHYQEKINSKPETRIIFNPLVINIDLTILQRLQGLLLKIGNQENKDHEEKKVRKGKKLNQEEEENIILDGLQEIEKNTGFLIEFSSVTIYLLFTDKETKKYKKEKIRFDLDTLKLTYLEQLNVNTWNVIIDHIIIQFNDDTIFKSESMNVLFNMKKSETYLTSSIEIFKEEETSQTENFDLDEKENSTINKLKHMNGKFNIEFNTEGASLVLSKNQIEILAQLFNELISLSLEKKSFEISDNFMDNTDFQNLYISTSKNATPLVSLRFEFQQLSFRIKDLIDESKEKHEYLMSFSNLTFYNFSYSDLIELYLSNEDLVFYEEINNQKKYLIRRYQRLVKDFRKNEKSSILCDLKITNTSITNIITANAQLNGLLFNHYSGNQNWIQILNSNFTSMFDSSQSHVNSTSEHEKKPKTFSLSILFQDVALDYSPDEIASRLIINFDKISFSTNLITGSNLKKFDLELYDISFMLNDHIKADIIQEILHEKERTISFERDLEILNFARVGSLQSIEFSFSSDPYKTDAAEMNLEVHKGSLRLFFCHDSLNTFITIFKSLLTTLITDTPLKEDFKKEIIEKKEEIKVVEEFKEKKPFPSYSIIENYFILDTSIRQKLPEQFGRPEFELLISNFEIICQIHGGSDWDKSKDENFVKFSFYDIFLQYDICRSKWKFNFSINNIEIKDEIKNSQRNMLLSYFKNEKYPRGDNQKMFLVEIESIGSNDMNLTVEILPLRVNFHQESFEFLKTFIQEITPKEMEKPSVESKSESKESTFNEKEFQKTQSSYFRSVNISEIIIRFHYQPVKLSFDSFKQGDYLQLLNIIPLNGLDIKFNEMNLKGIYGNEVVKTIVDNMKQNSQNFDFIVRILPINSFIYIGSGLFDLIMLPVTNYKEGQLLRGMKNGLTSFVKKFSLGGINLTTQTLDGTNGALKMLGSYLGNENEEKRTQVPNGAKEGLLEGYSSMKLGFQKAIHSMSEIPKDYETNGAQGVAIKTVKSIPTIVFSPLVGTTEGVAKVLHGIRSWMDPNIQEENRALYKN